RPANGSSTASHWAAPAQSRMSRKPSCFSLPPLPASSPAHRCSLTAAGPHGDHMRRRDLILGGTAIAWPLPLRAQQKAVPVTGNVGLGSPDNPMVVSTLAAFRQGLSETGYVEGQNLAIEYRWAEARTDRLPALAAHLVGRKVDLIMTAGGDAAARAAKNATS